MSDYAQVTTATETRELAVRLAKSAVRARRAAGAQVVQPPDPADAPLLQG